MNSFYSILEKVSARMAKYKLTRTLHQILKELGLIKFVHYLFSLWFRINPTKEMKYEKQVFSEHAQELKAVYDALEDDKSRSVFENIIKYRVTSDWSYLKKARAADTIKTQYFVPELPFSDHEIIVDCGAFNGDTVKLFYEKVPGCRVVALEPDERNFESLQRLKLEGLQCINCGAWSKNTTLSFSNEGGGTRAGSIDDSGSIKIEVRALDLLPECQSATYIKMDIEGAEMEALKGAEKTIRTILQGGGRPKLAICLYHKPQDFFEIPLYIKKLNPDYKLFIHHHNVYRAFETVLYAI